VNRDPIVHRKTLPNGKIQLLREDEINEKDKEKFLTHLEQEHLDRDEYFAKKARNHFRKLKTKFQVNDRYGDTKVDFLRRGAKSCEFEIEFKTYEEVEIKEPIKCDLGHFHIETVMRPFCYERISMTREAAYELANWILRKIK